MISGEPIPDLNGALIDQGPRDAELLREYLGAIRARSLDGFIWLTSAAQQRLASLAQELSLTAAGLSPLMSYVPHELPKAGDRYQVDTVKNQLGVDTFTDLMARGYGMPLDTWQRLVTVESLQDPAITHLVASVGDEPFSGGTTIATGSSVGIWNMATPSEHQRKGAGRAVLLEALRSHVVQGRRIFYLIATEAGKRLYEQIGFRTVDEATLWLIGAAT